MYISNLGLNLRQRTISHDAPGQEGAGEAPAEAEANLTLETSGASNALLAGAGDSRIHFKSFLSRDVEIKGSITCAEEFFIDGKVEGEINSTGVVTVGKNAEITGQIKTATARIFGTLRGSVIADAFCELKAHSVFEGDVEAPRLAMEEGAGFVGNSKVTPAKSVAMP